MMSMRRLIITTDLRTVKGQETKKNIIHTSINILAQEGIEGISANKIADALKISKSNIFYHFKSVENILDEVFDTILNYMVEPITSHNFKNVKELIMFIGQGIYNLSSEERTIYVVTFQLYTLGLYNHKYQDVLLKQKKKIIQVISNELLKLTHSDKDTCKTVSEMVLMTLDGYGLSALLDDKHHHYKKLWEINTLYWCDLLSENKGGSHD